MLELRVKIEPLPIVEPMVVRLREDRVESEHDALLIARDGDRREYDLNGFSLALHAPSTADLSNDVILVLPGRQSAHRLIRAGSPHNTLLVTEQCDQLCVMCSQPPKAYHNDLFDHFAVAIGLAPFNAWIGISGGEPLLHKSRLFSVLESAQRSRPDLRFHVLTNGQHFEEQDCERLYRLGPHRVLWGIPLYSSTRDLHDEIVGKTGAFDRLQDNFGILARSAASIELRTVLMKHNWASLPATADYVTTRLPFIRTWALMQMEGIGYGRKNWDENFMDTSIDFSQIATAMNRALAHGFDVSLYNFPLCTVPQQYRQYAPSTISDWKRKYLSACESCGLRTACGGFFEWYAPDRGFEQVGAQ